jgi:hypothetical protein
MLYINNMDVHEVAESLGYKSNEKGRKAGYKQIKNYEKIFKNAAKKIIQKYDVL